MADPFATVESFIDEREEVMVSPNGRNPTLRNAHFLKPTFTFNSDHLPPPPSLIFSKPTFNQLKKPRLWSYKGHPPEKWKIWVHILKPKFQEIWKKAGIHEAILASTYKIPRDKNLIIGLAKRWCDETNTFIFPWGEVTITLEDIINLGNYSVLGTSFSTPLTKELTDVLNCMKKVHKEARLNGGRNVNAYMWMNYFMGSEQFEHEAFLALWLSKFVLIQSQDYIAIHHFCLAIHLSRGTRIALAPVVLARIYRDMRLLHNSMVESSKLDDGIRGISHAELVLMWAWERFSELRPNPNVIERGEPRSARWNGVTKLKVKDVSAALDSANMSFLWRPYAVISSNCMFSTLYRDTEQLVAVESDEIDSYARCLRVCELVGLGCIEQYLPHRVAMQFGFDQDLPLNVGRSNESPETAWSTYNRPFRDVKVYIPPRLFQSNVSSRYLDWWKGLVSVNEDATNCLQSRKHFRNDAKLQLAHWKHKKKRKSLATHASPSRCHKGRPEEYIKDDNLTIAQLLSRPRDRVNHGKTRVVVDGDSHEKMRDVDSEQVLNTHSGISSAVVFEIPTTLNCTTIPVELNTQSVPSSDNCKRRTSSTEKQTKLAEDANKANCPELNIFNNEEENCDNTKVPLSELKTRILRLEMIVDKFKAAKSAASSRGRLAK